jgi:hypothetical protein
MYKKLPEFSNNKFVKNWPKHTIIYGWLVSMSSGGKLKKHIHKEGWLSGTLYLETPSNIIGDQGAIRFSTDADHFPNIGRSNQITIKPKPLSLCLFPSSLFHETIEYADPAARRISLAFDVIKQE